MKFKKPKFWDYKKPSVFSFFLQIFTVPLIINNYLRELKDNKSVTRDYSIKTVCVGNIYLGGTGKTPSAIKISQILNDLKYSTIFVKKHRIETLDEERLLKKYGKVLVSSKRNDSLIEANKSSHVAIFDDGLQDSSINYDLTFVCFNTEAFIGNGMLIPAGPLREKIDSLKKYDGVFLNGKSTNLENAIIQIKKHNNDIKIFESSYDFTNLDHLNKNDSYVAFAGIGFPKNFYETLIENKINIVKFLEFPDHYKYRPKDIEKIVNISKDLNAKIITTEKDYERIQEYNYPNIENIKYLKIELKIKNQDNLISFLKESL